MTNLRESESLERSNILICGNHLVFITFYHWPIEHTDVEEDSRVNTLVQKLMGRIQFVDADGSHSSLFTHGIEFRRDAEKLRSRGFGAGVRPTSKIIIAHLLWQLLAPSPGYWCGL